jgi:hypothetical protein
MMLDVEWINQSALFLHILAAIGLTSAGVVQVAAGMRVTQAATGRELASWSRFARGMGPLAIVSAVLSLFTGGHLAGVGWGFDHPFVTLATIAIVLLAPVGPMVGGARLRRLADAGVDLGDAPVPSELRTQAADPVLWGAVHSQVGLAVGFVWIMTNKPGWLTTALVLLGTFAAGWLAGRYPSRRRDLGAPLPGRAH